MNILGIDFGTKRIGLAWVDDALGVVLPYGVIEEGNQSRQEQLISLLKEERIGALVVGLPINVEEEDPENENTKRVRTFVDSLKTQIDVPVHFIDERFSSAEADEMGGEASRDEKAAMVILNSFLRQ